MRIKTIKLFMAFTAILTTSALFAQKKEVGGEISVGARFGGTVAASLKMHSNYNKSAFELIAQFKDFDNSGSDLDGFAVTALFQKLAPLSGSSKLAALIGFGPSFNFKDEFNLGVSGMLGFDWRLKSVPITLQFDWMPTYYFINENTFKVNNGAITARFVLNRRRYKS
jgi:hypothetical protein